MNSERQAQAVRPLGHARDLSEFPNKMPPQIRVVIPTLGLRPEWLRRAIRSVATQAVPTELLVVAPSTAPVADVAEEFGASILRCDDPGLSTAVQRGLTAPTQGAGHRYVTWLGDDDVLAPDSLAAAAKALDARPDAVAAYGRCRFIDPQGRTLWVKRCGRVGAWYSKYGADLIPQPGSLLRASAVFSVGGIDIELAHAMDYDLFLKLQSIGRLVYLPRELASFRVHPNSITSTKGSYSESEMVRARAARRRGDRWYPLLRSVTGHGLDRAVLGVLRRIPAAKVTY